MRRRLWIRRVGRTLLALALAWPIVIAALSARYVDTLLHPPCPAGLQSAPAGFKPVEVALPNGLRLRGWWSPPQNGGAVVLMAGHGGSRDSMLPEARFLADHGFGALTLDYRQCAGQAVGLGAWETDEFHAAVDFVQAQPGVHWIAALGFSVGGSAVLRGSVSRPEVQAIIAEGQYADLWSEVLLTPPARPLSLEWQIQRGVALILWARLGVWPGRISSLEALPNLAPRPVLLIFGELEALGAQAQAQFAAAQPPKELWILPGVDHGGYALADPVAYQQRVLEFLESHRGAQP